MADTEYTGFMYAAHRDVLVVENLAKEIDPYTEAIAFHSQQAAEEMVKNINNNMKSIRYELGTRVRHQLRIIPELKFFVDDSLDYIEKIDSLLK